VGDSSKKADRGLGNSFKAFRVAGPLFGSGIQLAAAVTLFFFIGRWLDGKFGTEPWLMLAGALIGAGGGMYRFIKTAMEIGAEEDREEEEERKNVR
jgi:F0F1-type ATP synthase assembly protein I